MTLTNQPQHTGTWRPHCMSSPITESSTGSPPLQQLTRPFVLDGFLLVPFRMKEWHTKLSQKLAVIYLFNGSFLLTFRKALCAENLPLTTWLCACIPPHLVHRLKKILTIVQTQHMDRVPNNPRLCAWRPAPSPPTPRPSYLGVRPRPSSPQNSATTIF